MNLNLLFDDFPDGVLIAAEHELLMFNDAARHICTKLMQEAQADSDGRSIAPEIWRVCQWMAGEIIDLTMPEGEFYAGQRQQVRMRSRWVAFSEDDRPYLMVILEDQDSLRRQVALSEVRRYHLTPREAEVWTLHRAGYKRQEIAQQCYISLETVKKHLKSARAKMEDWDEAV